MKLTRVATSLSKIPRRTFLRSLLTASASLGSLLCFAGCKNEKADSLHSSPPLTWPTLKRRPTGELSKHTLGSLLETQEVITNTKNHAPYEQYFRLHAKKRKGYHALYEEFAKYLQNESRTLFSKNFHECSASERLELLSPIINYQSLGHTQRKASPLLRDFSKRILDPILLVYSRTEAWQLKGYESYPGLPIGLTLYPKAPPGVHNVKS